MPTKLGDHVGPSQGICFQLRSWRQHSVGGRTLGQKANTRSQDSLVHPASDPFSMVPMMIQLKCKSSHTSASPHPKLISCRIKSKAGRDRQGLLPTFQPHTIIPATWVPSSSQAGAHALQAESIHVFAQAFPCNVPLPFLTHCSPCQSHLFLYNLA